MKLRGALYLGMLIVREHGQWKILRREDTPVMPTMEEWMTFIHERKAAGQ
jgi:hypothetical protein